jgi:hypothetical protein
MDDDGRSGGNVRNMNDLISISDSVLRENGFSVRPFSIGSEVALAFEDDTILGFVYIFDSPESLIHSWQSIERQFITSQANRFRLAGEKAWNVYSVFLTQHVSDTEQTRQVSWIEENLDRTRKLAACGVNAREAILKTFLPILSLQYKPLLDSDDYEERLRRRLATISPSALDATFDLTLDPSEVLSILRGLS